MACKEGPFTATEVMKHERCAIKAGRASRNILGLVKCEQLPENYVGLAISGGGIRSATFALGGLQTLAKRGLLVQMDYLSTVSGGGYIGSWLTAWILREGFVDVNAGLASDTSRLPINARDPHYLEPRPIHYLRKYTSYLTPKVGLVSGDTWAAVAIYLRNLLLNQAILIGSMLLLLMVPRIMAWFLGFSAERPSITSLEWAIFGLAWLWAGCFAGLGLNAFHCTAAGSSFGRRRMLLLKPEWFAVPAMVAAFVAAFALAAEKEHHSGLVAFCLARLPNSFNGWVPEILVGAGMAGVLVLTVLTALLARVSLRWGRKSQATAEVSPVRPSAFRWILAAIASGALVVGLLYLYWIYIPSVPPANSTHAPSATDTRATTTTGSVRVNGAAPAQAPASSAPAPRPGTSTKQPTTKNISAGKRPKSTHVNQSNAEPSTAPKPVNPAPPYSGKEKSEVTSKKSDAIETSWQALRVTTLGPPLLILIFVLAGWLQIGVMGTAFPDAKREWLARAAGIVMVVGGAWAIFSAIALYSPVLFGKFVGKLSGVSYSWLVPPAWLTTVIGGLMAAQSSKTGGARSSGPLEWLAKIAPPVFLIGLGMILAWAMQCIIYGPPGDADAIPEAIWQWDTRTVCMILGAMMASSLIFFVDVNEFSMHLFYRNRLVRAYLGASNLERNPHPFTGFAADDDLRLSDLDPNCARTSSSYAGPYPLVCTALNLVAGDDLAWQQRKATSFIYSPKFCGYDHLEGKTKSLLCEQGYRPTSEFSGPLGPHLGTAMAASGAAASPNMGYHSSPAVAALMTFFDVRLGWWVGNPRDHNTWKNYGPAPYYLLNELLSKTDDESHYLYLSDGGHFENLGVYELIRRRLKLIIAFDGDSDGDYAFGDLGSLIEKCRRDLGADIEICIKGISPVGEPPLSESHYAIGKITYRGLNEELPEERGWLLYIKSSVCGAEPEDVLAYRKAHAVFPHDPTADQFFTESQFESYRALGEHSAACALSQLFGETDPLCADEMIQVMAKVYR